MIRLHPVITRLTHPYYPDGMPVLAMLAFNQHELYFPSNEIFRHLMTFPGSGEISGSTRDQLFAEYRFWTNNHRNGDSEGPAKFGPIVKYNVQYRMASGVGITAQDIGFVMDGVINATQYWGQRFPKQIRSGRLPADFTDRWKNFIPELHPDAGKFEILQESLYGNTEFYSDGLSVNGAIYGLRVPIEKTPGCHELTGTGILTDAVEYDFIYPSITAPVHRLSLEWHDPFYRERLPYQICSPPQKTLRWFRDADNSDWLILESENDIDLYTKWDTVFTLLEAEFGVNLELLKIARQQNANQQQFMTFIPDLLGFMGEASTCVLKFKDPENHPVCLRPGDFVSIRALLQFQPGRSIPGYQVFQEKAKLLAAGVLSALSN